MRDLMRLLRFVRPYWYVVLAAVLMMSIVGAAHGLFPKLAGHVIGRVLVPNAPDLPVEILKLPSGRTFYLDEFTPVWIKNVWTMIGFAILVTFIANGICDYCGNCLINFAGLSAVTDLRQRVFDKVLRQGAAFYETHSTGKLMSSIMLDIEKIQLATSSMLADWLRQLFSALALLLVLIGADWRLSIIALAVFPLVVLPTARLGKRIRRTTRRAQDTTAEVNQILQEALSGHVVVKSFCGEDHESRRFRDAARRLKWNNMRYIAQQAIASPLITFFGAALIVALVAYGRDQIKSGAMKIEDFMAFIFALLLFMEPIKRLAGIHNIFQQAVGASERVFEYLGREDDIENKPGAQRLRKFEKSIAFETVSFRYPNSPNGFLINGMDLEVKAGEVVALVGPSGAGKTTLVNLVPRFYDVTSGRVLIDGVDVRDLDLASLRDHIGIVSQDTFLFNDTIAANLRYGKPHAGMDEVHRAAASALAEEFILALPNGYETVIGERGLKLSGGQRQRIAIARALLKNAPILILDEATSHLDTESEVLVQSALANLMAGRTVIVIAHRLSTVRRADKIVVLDQGRISETGTHEELVAGGGIYQRLHNLQFLDTDSTVVS